MTLTFAHFNSRNSLTIAQIGDIQEQIKLERNGHKRFDVQPMSGAGQDDLQDNRALPNGRHRKAEKSDVDRLPRRATQQPKIKYNTNKSLPPTPQATPLTDRFPDIDIPVICAAKERRRKRATTILNDPSSMARFRDENKFAIKGLLQALENLSDAEDDEDEERSDVTFDLGDYLRRRFSRSSTVSFASRSSVWADEHHAGIFRVASDAPPVPLLDASRFKGDSQSSDNPQKHQLQRSFSSKSTLCLPAKDRLAGRKVGEISDCMSSPSSAASRSTFDLGAFPTPPTHAGLKNTQAAIPPRVQARSNTNHSPLSLPPAYYPKIDIDNRRLSTASTASVYSQASMAPTVGNIEYFTAAPNAPPVPPLPTKSQITATPSASSSSSTLSLSGRGPKGSRFVEDMDRWDQSLRMSFASAAPPAYFVDATVADRQHRNVRPPAKIPSSSSTDKVKFAVQTVRDKVIKVANNRSLSEGILKTASLGRVTKGSRSASSRPAAPTRSYSHVVDADEHYKGATVVSPEELQKDLAPFGANPLQGSWYSPAPPQPLPGTSWYRPAPTTMSPPPKAKRPANLTTAAKLRA